MSLQALSFSQASLSLTILISTYLTYLAITPPNPRPLGPHSKDTLYLVTHRHFSIYSVFSVAVLATIHAFIVLVYPNIPMSLSPYSPPNSLNPGLFSWSAATVVPLAFNTCLGAPLRLISYRGLGKNFTFQLAEPDCLTTTGVYRYVQHPSYTALGIVLISNVALLGRLEGVLAFWIPPGLFGTLRKYEWVGMCLGATILFVGTRARIGDEERMLKTRFGKEWEEWNARTKRFVPGVF